MALHGVPVQVLLHRCDYEVRSYSLKLQDGGWWRISKLRYAEHIAEHVLALSDASTCGVRVSISLSFHNELSLLRLIAGGVGAGVLRAVSKGAGVEVFCWDWVSVGGSVGILSSLTPNTTAPTDLCPLQSTPAPLQVVKTLWSPSVLMSL